MTFVLFPRRCARHKRSGFDESFFVALDLERQPFGAWNSADHRENRGCLDNAPLTRPGIFQLRFFEHFVPQHFSNLGVIKNIDVVFRFDSPRKIARHFRKIVAADNEQDFGCAIGKKHCGLTGRIAAACDDDGFTATNLTFQRSRSIINPHILKLFATLRIQSAVIRASRDQNTFCAEHSSATFHLQAGAVFIGAIIIKSERLRRCGKFCTEPIRLKLGEPGQIAATNPGRETKKVFDQGGRTSLTARSVTFQNDGVQSFGGGVNGGGKTGRTCTDDREVGLNFAFVLKREWTKQPGLPGDLAQRRLA